MTKRRGPNEGLVYRRKDGRSEAAISLGNGKRKRLDGRMQREVQEKKIAAPTMSIRRAIAIEIKREAVQ